MVVPERDGVAALRKAEWLRAFHGGSREDVYYTGPIVSLLAAKVCFADFQFDWWCFRSTGEFSGPFTFIFQECFLLCTVRTDQEWGIFIKITVESPRLWRGGKGEKKKGGNVGVELASSGCCRSEGRNECLQVREGNRGVRAQSFYCMSEYLFLFVS